MNPLVKKEIRLLLPGWLAILSLAIILPWIWKNDASIIEVSPVVLFFGTILIAADSFGREFSLGTFSLLMSQPVERRKIWRSKITLLVVGVAILFIAQLVSYELWFYWWLPVSGSHYWISLGDDWWMWVGASATLILIGLSGGLWTTLLLRQIAAAFWITFLAPAGILVAITLFLPSKLADNVHVVIPLLYSTAGIYVVASFWLAHRLFHRAQDVAWTGGVINFSGWRYFETGFKSSVSTRHRKPGMALLKKEFQLHSISLFCVCALLALHIGIFFLRIFYANSHRNSLAAGVSDFFWMLWLVIPLVIGCTAVAEERKLGVAEEQFCLPVSRRAQFAIKFIPIMIFGTLMGGVMPILLETVTVHFGTPSEFFRPGSHPYNGFGSSLVWFQISIVALAAGLVWVGFFASTLARNFLQALSIATVISTGCCLLIGFIAHERFQLPFLLLGIKFWNPFLPVAIAILTSIAVFLWLTWRNFSLFQEGWRLWRGNLLGIMGALVFIVVSSAAIYNRAWEIFEPADLPHGPEKFSLANPPKLNGEYGELLVRLPDGRVWFDSLGYPFEYRLDRWKQFWWMLTGPLPKSAGPRQFIAGSNWVSATAQRFDRWPTEGTTNIHIFGYLDTVGVKSNGTLWISSESKPKVWTGGEMMQFGDETNWKEVVRSVASFLLLKKDGTLWLWGAHSFDWNNLNSLQTNWPTVRISKPQQIGTNSDWKEIFGSWPNYARKTDGSVWWVFFNEKTDGDKFNRQTNLDQIVFESFSTPGNGSSAYVDKGGTLWVCDRHSDENNYWTGIGFLQVGKETNWLAVAVTWRCMVALKSDGSLWKWNFSQNSTAEVAKIPPTRLGIHNDWVGLTGTWNGVVSLAADGSLWLWRDRSILLKPPKQPEFLGNIFGKTD
jgi:ABC-type transport system involved in multi-copper enzyme maturation permease subunit